MLKRKAQYLTVIVQRLVQYEHTYGATILRSAGGVVAPLTGVDQEVLPRRPILVGYIAAR